MASNHENPLQEWFHFLISHYWRDRLKYLAKDRKMSRSKLVRLIFEKSLFQLDELEADGMSAGSSGWKEIERHNSSDRTLHEMRVYLGVSHRRLKGHHHFGRTFSMAMILRFFIIRFFKLVDSLGFEGALKHLANLERVWMERRTGVKKIVHMENHKCCKVSKIVKLDRFTRPLEMEHT